LIEAAKQAPGKLSYASAGPGTPANLVCERFKSEASLDILHVPYKGNAPAVNDVLGGQVPMMCNNLAGTLPYADGGRLKLLAVTGEKRSPFLPDVPTFGEYGIENLETSVWMSIVAPAGTPEPVIARLNEVIGQALLSEDVKRQFANFGAIALPPSVAGFRDRQQREKELWGDIIKSLGLTAN
nr:tripartite tricarboxylate transporter substrate binding protein [Pseudomonas sp.]